MNPTKQPAQAHTAGPWRVLNASVFTHDTCVRICDPYNGMRANFGLMGPGHHLLPIDEREANARLIAAAPELLAALKELVQAYDDARAQCRGAELLTRARAAIARAEGKAL